MINSLNNKKIESKNFLKTKNYDQENRYLVLTLNNFELPIDKPLNLRQKSIFIANAK